MKYCIKIIVLLGLIFASLIAAEPAYYSNQFLFALSPDEQPLTAEQCATLKTPYADLNKMIKKFNVIKIENWLSNAKDTEHDGNIYLNRIYRLVTQQNVQAPFNLADEIANSSTAILSAEPEAIMRKHTNIPNDPMKGNQWYLNKAKAHEAWQLWDLEGGEVPGDRHVVVAIVDDGVEYTHPDLWKNIWINQDEISEASRILMDSNSDGFLTAEEVVNFVGDANGNGVTDLKDVISSSSFLTDGSDDDADGYIDNLIGWDTNESGSSFDDDNNPIVTNNSHGTHVAGLAGATTHNSVGIASVAYNISIMPVKATGDETTNSINTGYDGMLYAAQAGADIINCSWGGPGYNSYVQNQINTLYNTYGVLVVAAAGNGDDDGNPSDEPHYPSGYNHVVSVTAVNSSDIFSWANYGAASGNFYGVDIAAPGENMLSTYLTKESSYTYLAGTSMASPFVASCFALLKSVYPDSSTDWLVDRMLSNTDPIDDLNPTYAGQLGTGRVNILKALVSDKWPNLSLHDQSETITNGDGDSILNPGETVNLFVELQNDTGWTQAVNVQGILGCADDNVIILDSVATWSSISANTHQLNDGNGFSVQFMNTADIKTYAMELKLVSNETTGYTYRKTISLNITIYLDQEGFPYQANNEVEVSPVFVDINDDGFNEIIFADKSGELYMVDKNGQDINGFPVSLNSQPGGIAVADIDLDDTLEIVVSLFEKQVKVYDVYGHYEWTRHSSFYITAMPVIGNIDDDEELEVVVGSYDKNLYAFNHDSTDVTGFPYASGQLLHSGVSLADVDSDGKDEIFYAAKNGQLGFLDPGMPPVSGWPVNTSGSITSEPHVIIGNDNTAVVLIGNDLGDMYGFNLDGTQRFIIDGQGSIKVSPAIFINAGEVAAFFATTTGNIYKIDLNEGVLDEGWPRIMPTQFYNSLVITDISNDALGRSCVLGMGSNGKIYAVDVEGNNVENQGFPLNTRYLSKSALAVSDIDNDGDNEIITGNFFGLSVIDLKGDAGDIFWSIHRGDISRKGSTFQILSDIEDVAIPEKLDFKLIGNAPNPFNPTTSIRYSLSASVPVELKVYRLDGKLLFSKTVKNNQIGLNEIRLDMDAYSSGIYLYVLEAGTEMQKAKMIYLK